IAWGKSELSSPVWGSADVKAVGDAVRMFERTAVDGVMIGRAALHNPFIFRDIMCGGRPFGSAQGKLQPADELNRRIDAMQRYLAKIDAAPQPDKWKLHKARTVIGWFSKGIPHGRDIRLGLRSEEHTSE